MGLEASDRLNKQVFNRHETASSFLAAAKTVLGCGLHLSIDVLADNPYETEDDLREVASTLNALPVAARVEHRLALADPVPPDAPLRAGAQGPEARAVRHRRVRFDARASRPGGYRTPAYWRDLVTKVLPHLPAEHGAKLIAAGPRHPQAVRIVERLVARIERARRVSAWLKRWMPWLWWAAALVYRIGGLFRRRAAPDAEPPPAAGAEPAPDGAPEPTAEARPQGERRDRAKRKDRRKR